MNENWIDYLTMEELNFDPRIVDIENEDEKYMEVKNELER